MSLIDYQDLALEILGVGKEEKGATLTILSVDKDIVWSGYLKYKKIDLENIMLLAEKIGKPVDILKHIGTANVQLNLFEDGKNKK